MSSYDDTVQRELDEALAEADDDAREAYWNAEQARQWAAARGLDVEAVRWHTRRPFGDQHDQAVTWVSGCVPGVRIDTTSETARHAVVAGLRQHGYAAEELGGWRHAVIVTGWDTARLTDRIRDAARDHALIRNDLLDTAASAITAYRHATEHDGQTDAAAIAALSTSAPDAVAEPIAGVPAEIADREITAALGPVSDRVWQAAALDRAADELTARRLRIPQTAIGLFRAYGTEHGLSPETARRTALHDIDAAGDLPTAVRVPGQRRPDQTDRRDTAWTLDEVAELRAENERLRQRRDAELLPALHRTLADSQARADQLSDALRTMARRHIAERANYRAENRYLATVLKDTQRVRNAMFDEIPDDIPDCNGRYVDRVRDLAQAYTTTRDQLAAQDPATTGQDTGAQVTDEAGVSSVPFAGPTASGDAVGTGTADQAIHRAHIALSTVEQQRRSTRTPAVAPGHVHSEEHAHG